MDIEMELAITQAIARAARELAASQQIYQTPDKLLSVRDVAKALHIGTNTANKLVQTGVIRSLNLGGRKVRRRELEAWMERMEGMDLTDPLHPVPLPEAETA